MGADYTGHVSLSGDLDISGDLVLNGGTLDTGSHTLNLDGDLVVDNGELTIGGTCEINGDIHHTGGIVDASDGTLNLVGDSKSINVTSWFEAGDVNIHMDASHTPHA